MPELGKFNNGGAYALLVDLATKKSAQAVFFSTFIILLSWSCQFFFLFQLQKFAWAQECPYELDYAKGWNDPTDLLCDLKKFPIKLDDGRLSYRQYTSVADLNYICEGELAEMGKGLLGEGHVCSAYDYVILITMRVHKSPFVITMTIFLFVNNVFSQVTGPFFLQATLLTKAPEFAQDPKKRFFAGAVLCVDMVMIVYTMYVGFFVVAVFSGDLKDYVLNSLALGFITEIDELILRNIAQVSASEAIVEVPFEPTVDPLSIYDRVKGGGQSIAQMIHRVSCSLVKWQLCQFFIALSVLNLKFEMLNEIGIDGFSIFTIGPFLVMFVLFGLPLLVAICAGSEEGESEEGNEESEGELMTSFLQ
jgi:hypothetical protein